VNDSKDGKFPQDFPSFPILKELERIRNYEEMAEED
jgi:hypothetical protein